jgi:hypothetical protein
MGDMGDFWRDIRESRSAFKRERAQSKAAFIEEVRQRSNAYGFVGAGVRFLFEVRDERGFFVHKFDYWPQSGKWCEVNAQRYRSGERSLMRRLDELGVRHAQHEDDDAGLRRTLSRSCRID